MIKIIKSLLITEWSFIWINLNILHTRMLFPTLVEICSLDRSGEDFEMPYDQCTFFLLLISPLGKLQKGMSIHLKYSKMLHPRILCATFGWNRSSGSGGEHFFDLSIYFSLNLRLIKIRCLNCSQICYTCW